MQSWFEIIDVAPVIRNEAFLEQDDEDLVASKSGLLQNNAVEPYPRTMNNALYDSDSNEEGGEEDTDVDQYSPPSPTHHNNKGRVPLSPTYEDIDEELRRAAGKKGRPLPTPPLDLITDPTSDPWLSEPSSPTLSSPPPPLPMVYPHVAPYGPSSWGFGTDMIPHHTHSFHIPHPRPAPDRSLEQSALPCALSYQLHYQNGIPPHHSSNFFKKVKRTLTLSSHMSHDTRMSDTNLYGHSLLKNSPSVLSRANTEPIPKAPLRLVIPRRERKRNRLFTGKKKQPKKTKKPQPLPYEVPYKPLNETENESKDETTTETEAVPRPQTSTPKKKSPGKSITLSRAYQVAIGGICACVICDPVCVLKSVSSVC